MNNNLFAIFIFSVLLLSHGAFAQTRDATLAVLAKLQGAERQMKLLEGALKDGSLVWYSSTTAEDALALIRKFNEQYPTIKIHHFRSPSEKLLERILAESRAGAFKGSSVQHQIGIETGRAQDIQGSARSKVERWYGHGC